ncbi:MAG TPA: hypothetical protein VE548_15355 [Nitrososphaeraceae archaeon]|jgi:hypothetical protein|nr:hypothetical protein [Nitrososphaeraceae archaeon]
MAQQKLLAQELSVSQILSEYGNKLIQIRVRQNNRPNINMLREQQQQLLAQELSISQILRAYGKQFTQIREQYTDGINGRCAMGVIMSYYGWDGKCCTNAERRLYAALVALRRAGISKESLIELNDSGMTFDEIADYLDQNKRR